MYICTCVFVYTFFYANIHIYIYLATLMKLSLIILKQTTVIYANMWHVVFVSSHNCTETEGLERHWHSWSVSIDFDWNVTEVLSTRPLAILPILFDSFFFTFVYQLLSLLLLYVVRVRVSFVKAWENCSPLCVLMRNVKSEASDSFYLMEVNRI